jgi:hypothetical protein
MAMLSKTVGIQVMIAIVTAGALYVFLEWRGGNSVWTATIMFAFMLGGILFRAAKEPKK